MTMQLLAATQEEVLRSISTNFEQSGDPFTFLAILLGTVGGVLLIVWVGHYRKRLASPKQLNHPGKLMRELSRKVGLRPAELKKLRAAAAATEVSSPLVLMLCPSVMRGATRPAGEAKQQG